MLKTVNRSYRTLLYSTGFGRFMGLSSSSKNMSTYIVEPSGQHTASLIFLHGLGDTGEGWSQLFRMKKKPHVRYVFPTAPIAPVTLNGGMPMPSWFDIYGLAPDSPEDEQGVKQSAQKLAQLISDEEKRGIPRSRIVIGGFSQGGAVALYTAFTSGGSKLGGLLALSTWMPSHKTLPELINQSENKALKILQCHGQVDPVVQFFIGVRTSEILKANCPNFTFKQYENLAHSSCDEELVDVFKFLNEAIP
ncbi:DgyrCDS608 [Dimorphilus gyrociliatus]|uniref:palmitoyl-protein hydrolase n=2 Tax=Dimorphilus gyrociliatus TaxID=2664684 RepID=A0A7I8V4Y3_9ANNE|nr:DgyrCDS608 [Dimorphilus gyrociliatus]